MEKIISVCLYLFVIGFDTWIVKFAYFSKNVLNRRISTGIIIISQTMLATFRYMTGTDSAMYILSYNDLNRVNRYQEFEGGYIFLVKVLNNMNLSYHALFFCFSFLQTIFILLLIKNEITYINVRLAMFIYSITLYLSSFNIMRQALAIVIVMYAFSVFMDGKYIQSIFLILFALLFHNSALLGFCVIIVKILYKSKHKKILTIMGCGILLYFIFHRELLGNIIYSISGNLYYASYVLRDTEETGNVFLYIVKIIPIIIIATLYFKKYEKNIRYLLYYVMMLGGYILSMLGVFTATQVQRVGYYFSYLQIILLAFCGNNDSFMKKIGKKTITVLIVMYYLLMFFYSNVYKGHAELIPYLGIF